MPIHEYVCPRGHVETRIVSIKADPPKYVKCKQVRRTDGGPCNLRGEKRQVYRVSVGGDLPTRGAF